MGGYLTDQLSQWQSLLILPAYQLLLKLKVVFVPLSQSSMKYMQYTSNNSGGLRMRIGWGMGPPSTSKQVKTSEARQLVFTSKQIFLS